MNKLISWKKLKGSIQKKTKNYIIKRTKIFHNQIQEATQKNKISQYSKPLGRLKRTRKKRKSGQKVKVELPGLIKSFRHQISRTRTYRKKSRKIFGFLSPFEKRKLSNSLFQHTRNLFRLELKKIAAVARFVPRQKILPAKQSLILSSRALTHRGKKFKGFLSRKKRIYRVFPSWKRLLYQLRRKKVLWGKWRTRKYYRVLRKSKQKKYGRNSRISQLKQLRHSVVPCLFDQTKQGKKKYLSPVNTLLAGLRKKKVRTKNISKKPGNITNRIQAKIGGKKKSKKFKHNYLAYRKSAPTAYKIWRKKYLRFQEKKTKKKRGKSVAGLKPSKKKGFSRFRGKLNKPRRKRRHRFRRINRLRPSVVARRRLRRKYHRFFVYRDQYNVLSARRIHLQLKNGYMLYQKKARSLAAKNFWWFSSVIGMMPAVLDKNPISFRRVVLLNANKKQKRGKQKNSEMKLVNYPFLQTKKYNNKFLPVIYPPKISSRFQGFQLTKKPKVMTKVIKKSQVTKQQKGAKQRSSKIKDISSSSWLQKKKQEFSFDNNRRSFSSVTSSQATKFFARKKKTDFKALKRLKKQKVQQKLGRTKKVSSSLSTKKLGKKLSSKLFKHPKRDRKKGSNLKRNRSVFGRLNSKSSGKRLRKNSPILVKKKKGGLVQKPSRRRRRRRLVHKNWTFRFPRWKIYYRNLWRYERQNEKYRWVHADLFPGRKYRWIQQVFRIRHPRKEKKNKWLQRLTFQNQSFSLRKRKSRLINRLMHYKLFSKFYGPFTSKRWASKVMQMRRINPRTITRKSLSLSWYDHRLDITVYRIGLAPSLKVAQTLIARGYIFVNGSQNLSTHYSVEPWDVVAVTPDADLKKDFEWYWFIRNQYRRHAYKRKTSQYKNVHPQKLTYSFGFRTRLLHEVDLPRRDRIQGKEFERLLLWKSKPW